MTVPTAEWRPPFAFSIRIPLLIIAVAVLLLPVSSARAADPLGQVTEYHGLTSDAQHLTRGPDGNMWFTERQVPAIGRVTPSGEVTLFSAGLRAHSAPCGLAVGPDGNLWFADEGGPFGETGAIGRITPTGTITEFTSGLESGDKPQDIVEGPDGNLWWSSFAGQGIGKITTSGVITDLSGGLNPGLELEESRSPGGLVVGPDGNIWFSNYSEDGSAIGRVVPSTGAITEYVVPSYGVPNRVTAGGDGNVWFIDERNETIDRITPAGVITAFDTGAILNSTEEQQPTGIALGPDGNIWFTYNGKSSGTPPPAYVGRITPAGVVTTFNLPGQYAGGITSGPDGNLWLLNSGVTRITTNGETITIGASAAELASGSDGNMWFDDGEGGETIGKIGTAGSLASGGSGPGNSAPSAAGSTPAALSGTAPSKSSKSAVLTIGKTTLRLKGGVAHLSLFFPGPGRLTVAGKGIKRVNGKIKTAGKANIAIRPTAKTLAKLNATGKARVPIKLTFTPTGGKADTTSTTLKLEHRR